MFTMVSSMVKKVFHEENHIYFHIFCNDMRDANQYCYILNFLDFLSFTNLAPLSGEKLRKFVIYSQITTFLKSPSYLSASENI